MEHALGDPTGIERRAFPRYEAASLEIAYASGDAFLFARPDNISEMGVFIPTSDPLPAGSPIRLRLVAGDGEKRELDGVVRWSSDPERPGFGMGVEFVDLTPEQREWIVLLTRDLAPHEDDPTS